MSSYAMRPDDQDDKFGSGVAGAIGLHVVLAGVFVAVAMFAHTSSAHWGENASSVGAIQASMVSAIPLPQKFKPVEKSVLAPDQASPAPVPPPKEAVAPPPRPTDILIKNKNLPKKVGPVETPAPPKHPQPTPPTAKAQTGQSADQLPQSTTQMKNGTATATVQDRTFGNRYAYYVQQVSQKVAQNWYTYEVDPKTSQGKRTTIVFDIERDGSPANVRLLTSSGSPTLDTSAMRALQRVDGFGPLPAGNQITVEYTFDYKQQ
ncbi:MAG: energy transducer TonB [Acidobacteria bacterium]|nr:energy transducer TonB [Acidobacteriota bacterium]